MIRYFMVLFVSISFFLCSSAHALDYANMSDQELADLQGAITNAPPAEQEAYRLEWEKRLKNMTEEEKKQYSRSDAEEQDENKRPQVLGRGYDSQGMGSVIYGGSPPVGK